MTIFRVGQRVTMKENGRWRTNRGEVTPIYGEVYTVHNIFEVDASVHLRFVEIVNPVDNYIGMTDECGWEANAFRPVVFRKTDISVFEKMLNPDLVKRIDFLSDEIRRSLKPRPMHPVKAV